MESSRRRPRGGARPEKVARSAGEPRAKNRPPDGQILCSPSPGWSRAVFPLPCAQGRNGGRPPDSRRRVGVEEARDGRPSRARPGGPSAPVGPGSRRGAGGALWLSPRYPPGINPPGGPSNFPQPECMRTVRTVAGAGERCPGEEALSRARSRTQAGLSLAGSLPSPPRGGKDQEPQGHPGQRVSERGSRAGPGGATGALPDSLEVRGKPEELSGFPPLPPFEKSARRSVQLLPARMYENRADGGSGRAGEAYPARGGSPGLDRDRSPPTPLEHTHICLSLDERGARSVRHRPKGNRSPPLVRAPPATALGGRCSQPAGPTRRGGTTREDARLPAPPRPTPAERDRDAPSPPVVLERSVSRAPDGRPRTRAGRSAPKGTRRPLPEARLSNPPSVASAPPATRTNSCETGPGSRTRGNTPSTRLRGSAEKGGRRSARCPGHRAGELFTGTAACPRPALGPGTTYLAVPRRRTGGLPG